MKTNRFLSSAFVLTGFMLLATSCNTTKAKSTKATTKASVPEVSFVVTDAMQTKCYDNNGNIIDAPNPGELYYGQDAQYQGIEPSYTDNGDGTGSIPAGVRAVRGEEGVYGVNDFVDNNDNTITDKATGLMWSKQDSGAVNDDGTIRATTDENFGYGRTWTRMYESRL